MFILAPDIFLTILLVSQFMLFAIYVVFMIMFMLFCLGKMIMLMLMGNYMCMGITIMGMDNSMHMPMDMVSDHCIVNNEGTSCHHKNQGNKIHPGKALSIYDECQRCPDKRSHCIVCTCLGCS